jgi:hypothetical protein
MSTAALSPSRPQGRILGTAMLVIAVLAALGLAIAALVVSLNDDSASVPASPAVVAPASQSSLNATVERTGSSDSAPAIIAAEINKARAAQSQSQSSLNATVERTDSVVATGTCSQRC